MAYVFGPVPSRRLGLSLGVDLIPPKTCSYDCLYCQVGKTTLKTVEVAAYHPIGEVIRELDGKLRETAPDTVTLAGSGEPTLHPHIDKVISHVRETSDTRVALLTNGSLLYKKEVRDRIRDAHIIMPTLTTVSQKTFMAIHRAHEDLEISRIIEGIKRLREEYQGQLYMEVMLLKGLNDSDQEIEALRKVMEQINPDRIQLNTVVRPPSDRRAISLDRERLKEIEKSFGPKAEIIAESPFKGKKTRHERMVRRVVEMAGRRPLRAHDVASAMNLKLEDAQSLIKGLLIKGNLREKEHLGERYYIVG